MLNCFQGGSPAEAMTDLTGCPSTSFFFDRMPTAERLNLHSLLLDFNERGYLMTAGTRIWADSENGELFTDFILSFASKQSLMVSFLQPMDLLLAILML